MARSPFSQTPRQPTGKPGPAHQLAVDKGAALGNALRTVLLFDDRRLTDIGQPGRQVGRRGAISVSRGSHGGQVTSGLSGASGAAFSPCLTMAPVDVVAASGFTLSALVDFDGTPPQAGSFNATGAALAADDSGRMPLFVSRAAGTFRLRAPSEFEFLASGSPLLAATLSGWHRLTVVVAGSLVTLYVDGGDTFTGTATSSFANFGLRSVLGSDVTSGTQWLWPVADLFFWSRNLAIDEVAAHSRRPYAALKTRLSERWIAPSPALAAQQPGNPWDPVFTDDFGAAVAFGVLTQMQGAGGLSAIPNVLRTAPAIAVAAQIDGGGFMQVDAFVRKTTTATLAGSGGLSANPTRIGTGLNGFGVGTLFANPRILVGVRGQIDGAANLNAVASVRNSVRAAMQGQANFIADAAVALPFNRATANLGGVGTLRATPIVRGAPTTLAVMGGAGSLTVTTIIQNSRSTARPIGEGRLYAKPTVRRRPHVRPGMADGAEPDLITVEIETYVPGQTSVVTTNSHGTRPHGSLARQPPSKLENTSALRASDMGYRTYESDQGGLVSYPPLLSDAYQIDAALTLDPSRTSSGAAWGSVLLANPRQTFDAIIGVQNSDGRPVTMKTGRKVWDPDRQYLTDPHAATLTPFFSLLATPWSLNDDGLQIPLRDISYYLEKPLQTDFYGGHGQLDGTPDLAGKPKPIARGGWPPAPIQNVTPTLVDPVALIYQYSDAAGQVVNLYEGGATGTGAITYAGDTTNLYAGSTPQGRYRTDNSRGLFQLGSVPVRQITVDVVGNFAVAGPKSHPFFICQYILSEEASLSLSAVDLESFALMQAQVPNYVGGLYFGSDDQWSCVQAVDAILAAFGANLVPTRAGKLKLTMLRAINANEPVVANYDVTQIINISRQQLPQTLDPPPYRFRVGYQHNYSVMTSGVNTALATGARQQFIASPDRFSTWYDPSLIAAYRRPNDYEAMPGPLLNQADALDVANALGALWGVKRRLYQVTLPKRLFGPEIGQVVHITYPIEQLANGQNGRIVGYSLRANDGVVSYSVLV